MNNFRLDSKYLAYSANELCCFDILMKNYIWKNSAATYLPINNVGTIPRPSTVFCGEIFLTGSVDYPE